jgi:hypothetical protein
LKSTPLGRSCSQEERQALPVVQKLDPAIAAITVLPPVSAAVKNEVRHGFDSSDLQSSVKIGNPIFWRNTDRGRPAVLFFRKQSIRSVMQITPKR